MSEKKPVVVYGASGFSGRLVVEYLREYHIPFIAAGRNRAKIEETMDHVPGIETAQFEIAEVGRSVEELTELFAGAKVVCNTVGPFIYSGPLVIEPSLKAGCHYLDISGVQEWPRHWSGSAAGVFACMPLFANVGCGFGATRRLFRGEFAKRGCAHPQALPEGKRGHSSPGERACRLPG